MSSRKRAKTAKDISKACLPLYDPTELEPWVIDDLGLVKSELLHCKNQSCVTKHVGDRTKSVESLITPLGRKQGRGLYLVLQCNNCKNEWMLCLVCGHKQRTQVVTRKQYRDHDNNNHKNVENLSMEPQSFPEQTFVNEETVNAEDNDTMQSLPNDGDDCVGSDTEQPWIDVVNSRNLGFGSKESQIFFEQCYWAKSRNGGRDYLAKRSSRSTNYGPREYERQALPTGHGELQVRIAHLVFLLTRGAVDGLVPVLYGAYKVGCEDGFACFRQQATEAMKRMEQEHHVAPTAVQTMADSFKTEFCQELITTSANYWSTTIPKSWNEVRSFYLEGNRSIIKNLPIPVVYDDIPGHSYVSVIDCIRHFLGQRDLSNIAILPTQISESQLTSVKHSSESRRAKEIIEQFVGNKDEVQPLKSYLIFWSDDVEPNRTKANRGSIWLLTATIATHLGNGHCLENTFPIAVGRKGDDHHPVVAKVEDDMMALRTASCPPFYVGRKLKKIRMSFEVFCTLQDQPERRDFNAMRAGNGATSGRFGVSANHGALYASNVLPACKVCLERMENALLHGDGALEWPMPPCQHCVRWDVLDNPHDLATWEAPNDYPMTERIVERGGKRWLRSFRITYESLKAAVDTAHRGYVQEGWTNQNCETFLEVEGMSSKFISTVMEHCVRSYSLMLAKGNPAKYQAILDSAELNPQDFQKAPYPSSWCRPTISLQHHPDVIMHLIFLGVVKTTVTQIQNCLAAQSKLTSFLKSTAGYLKEFSTMTIDWIAIQPYQGGKMGGWVSENFLGFSRILPWFFQNIDSAVELVTDFSPPDDLPQNKWLHRHNQYWLQIRGLATKGNRQELRDRVAKAMAEGAPEPIPAPEIPPASVEAVLLALMEVIKCVMSTEVTPALVNRTRYAVRVFLSKYDSLCRPLRQKTPAVLSSYNFICLLNLPEVMEKFGPLRCIWEGGPRGEGFVRFAKPHMTQGLRTNWHRQLLLKLHRDIAFTSILNSQQDESSGQEPSPPMFHKDTLRNTKGSFHKYAAGFEVTQRFLLHRLSQYRVPVSVLLVKDEGGVVLIYAVAGDYDSVLHLPMNHAGEPEEKFGLYYYSFEVPSGSVVPWMSVASGAEAMNFGLLLPMLTEDDPNNSFAIISSNWQSLSPSVDLSSLVH